MPTIYHSGFLIGQFDRGGLRSLPTLDHTNENALALASGCYRERKTSRIIDVPQALRTPSRLLEQAAERAGAPVAWGERQSDDADDDDDYVEPFPTVDSCWAPGVLAMRPSLSSTTERRRKRLILTQRAGTAHRAQPNP